MSEWRMIEDGPLFVSDHGEVRSEATGRTLKPTVASNGYLTFGGPMVRGKRRTMLVHQEVAIAFIGPRDGMCVNHKDGNKLNNALSNLEIVTYAENSAHASRHGLIASGERHGSFTHPEKTRRGEAHPLARLTADDVQRIRTEVAAGASCRKIAERLGVSDSSVRRAARGIDWAHIGGATPIRYKSPRGHDSPSSKLSIDQATELRRLYENGEASQTELAARFSVSQSTVSNIVRAKGAQ